MLGSNRLHHVAFGGWLLAVLLIAIPALGVPEGQPDDPARTERSAGEHESETAPQETVPVEVPAAPKVIDSGGADLSGAQDPAQDPDPEKGRAQADLKAQQEMARWALWMVVVSAIGVVVSAVAVGLVFLTLSEAKKTTQAAIDTVHSDRAWIVYEMYNVREVTNSTVGGRQVTHSISIFLNWLNAGRSPAIGARAFTNYKIIGENDPIPVFKGRGQVTLEDIGPPVGPGIVFQSETIVLDDNELAAFWGSGKRLIIYGRVDYKDIFKEDVPRHTETCGEFVIHNMPGGQWSISTLNFGMRPVGPQNSAS